MGLFKKLTSTLLTAFLLLMGTNLAQAIEIKDVGQNYWAVKEINAVLTDGFMSLDKEGKFRPEESMTRVEFVDALLKVLGKDSVDITTTNKFSDINASTIGFDSILRSDQIGLVYGYPDKTFQPERKMTRAESTSVMSHITKEAIYDQTFLNKFKDRNAVPSWAKRAYAKTIKYDIYVNYPDSLILAPKKDLSRAEGAVLLAKLKAKIDLVKDKYKNTEKVKGLEHITVYDKAPNNLVQVTNKRNIVQKGNVLKFAFCEKVNSKNWKVGDTVKFYAPKDLYTTEGTLVYPVNTKFNAVVEKVQGPKWFNKQARICIHFVSAQYPNGQTMNMSAIPLMYEGQLKEGKSAIAKKLGGYALGGALIGGGSGAAIGTNNRTSHNIGGSMAIGATVGASIGAGAGTIVGLITPGLNYKAKAGEEIYVLVTEDSSFYTCKK